MPKNIVVCCDGTGNEIGSAITNVLKLFRALEKNSGQTVYYRPGVGTIALSDAWRGFRQKVVEFLGLAAGLGLDDDVLSAYRFIGEHYEPGDKIYLFGFSRGAYTVRVVAALLHMLGMLPRDQLNLADYALTAYKRASGAASISQSEDAVQLVWEFGRLTGAKPVPIEFVGVWDTVASMIVPRLNGPGFRLLTFRHTRTNRSVKCFRQAMAIDERRRMFRLNAWTPQQVFRPNPYDPHSDVAQDIAEMWFAGVHADIGGGYPEPESGLSKYPLAWMIEQAEAAGLLFNARRVAQVLGQAAAQGSGMRYEPAAFTAMQHNESSKLHWRILEWIPKRASMKEWPARKVWLRRYLPRSEPRVIPTDASIHPTVFQRMAAMPEYRPINLAGRESAITSSIAPASPAAPVASPPPAVTAPPAAPVTNEES